MDGLSDVGVEVVNPGSKEGAVDTKIKALLLKIIHNESHRPGQPDQMEIIVLLSADRDYSPEIQALRRFSRFRVITFHSGNSKDYMMDETMIDAVSTRWDAIVAAATEAPPGEARQPPPPPSAASSSSSSSSSSSPNTNPKEPKPALASAASTAAPATAAPTCAAPAATGQCVVQDTLAARGPCAVITNTPAERGVLEQQTQRFQPGPGRFIGVVPPGGAAESLAAHMAQLSVQGGGGAGAGRLLYCVSCRQDFTWTVAEQAAFRQRGLQHEPRLCRACRADPCGGRR